MLGIGIFTAFVRERNRRVEMVNIRSMVFMMFLVPCLAQAKANPAGFVAAFRGDARILRGQDTVAARIGEQVYVGDELVTGKKGRLKILLTDDAIVSLGANTTLRLTQHLFEPSSHKRVSRLDLVRGLVRALVKHVVAGSVADFQIRHSRAVAGVRGTEFAMFTSQEGTKLVTLSGTVAWASAGGQAVLVKAGQGSTVADHGPSSPQAIAAADLKKLRSSTDVVQSPSALAMNIQPEHRVYADKSFSENGMVLDPSSSSDEFGDQPVDLNGQFEGSGTDRVEGGNVGLGLSDNGTFSGEGPMADSSNGVEDLVGDWSTGMWGDGFYGFDVSLKIKLERR